MGDRDDHSARGQPETLELRPSGRPLRRRVPDRWRRPATVALAFVLGVVVGAGAMPWWQAVTAPPPQEEQVGPPPGPFDEHAVELLLLDAGPPPRSRSGGPEPGACPLRVDAAFVLSGSVASTVLRIDVSVLGLGVHDPALPVTVSPTTRYQRAGELDDAVATTMTRYIDAACV